MHKGLVFLAFEILKYEIKYLNIKTMKCLKSFLPKETILDTTILLTSILFLK